MKKSWMDRLFPGRSGWIERAAREGLDAYAREIDGIPRNRPEAGAAEGCSGLSEERTPSLA